MAFSHLIDHLRDDPGIAAALTALNRGSITIPDLPLPARAAIASVAIQAHPGPALVVASRADRAEALATAIAEYLPSRTLVAWPAPEALPYEQLPFDLETATERAALLDALAGRPAAADSPIVVTPVHGLLQILMPPEDLSAATRSLRVGQRLSQTSLLAWATDNGFEFNPLVTEPGHIARRGSIVDLFPPGAALPVRVDFFGDEIEVIRPFDPHTQRSHDRLSEIRILPPAELPLWRVTQAAECLAALDLSGLRDEVRAQWVRTIEQMALGQTPPSLDIFAPYLVERTATLLDYAGADALIVVDEPGAIDLVSSQLERQAAELRDAFVANGELPPGLRSPIASWPRVKRALTTHRVLSLGVPAYDGQTPALPLALIEAPRFGGRLGDAVEAVRDRLAAGWRVVVATDQVDRLTDAV